MCFKLNVSKIGQVGMETDGGKGGITKYNEAEEHRTHQVLSKNYENLGILASILPWITLFDTIYVVNCEQNQNSGKVMMAVLFFKSTNLKTLNASTDINIYEAA